MGSNNATDCFVDLENDLLSGYYYALYLDSKKLKDDRYKFSDWKKENSALIDEFIEIKGQIGGKVMGWLHNLDVVRVKLVIKVKKKEINFLILMYNTSVIESIAIYK